MRLEKMVLAIEDAIEKRCFLPALALALIIPDICAKYDYPKIYNKKDEYNGHKGEGAAYAKWYDKNIGKYDIEPTTKIGLLDGLGCWKLRCGFLHSGSIDIDDIISTEDMEIHFKIVSSSQSNFKYTLGGSSSVAYSEDKKARYIELDIANFCGKILAVFKNSYLNNKRFIEESESRMLNYLELDY